MLNFQLSPAIKQRQTLVMTPQLQLAIKLLQMSNTELANHLETMAEENPFLEISKSSAEGTPGTDTATPAPEPAHSVETERAKDPDIDDNFALSSLDVRPQSAPMGEDDWDRVANLAAEPQGSLCGHVHAQLNLIVKDPSDHPIALALCEALEPTGWISPDLGDIAQRFGVLPMQVERVLLSLQRMEPTGIFARGLAECLRLQAVEAGVLCPQMALLLENLDLLADGKLRALARICGCTADDLPALVRQLRRFDPKPGLCFSSRSEPIIPPDLIVTKATDGWAVRLNRSNLPAITVNEDFVNSLQSARRGNSEVKGYVAEALNSARWLRRAVAQRNETTLKIGAEIVKRQADFLDKGLAHLRPLLLRDVADAVGVHESTVSRVTAGIMMATPRGTLRLKAFFSGSLPATGSADGEAAAAIRFKIRKIIEAESPTKPLSDEAIAKMITSNGIQLARRTVAKYREIEGIASSSQRRRQRQMADLAG